MILHADVDAFFASVEQRDDPRLRGRPTIVGGGVVMAASYEARAYGVRGAMGGRQARRLCPHAVVVPPRFHAYVEASKAVFEVFERTAPSVEGLSMEEAFLDVRGLEHISGTPADIGARLRREVREQVGLTITVGIASSKVVAKMASRAAKPDGLLAVPPGRELEFLRPLRVEVVWGVGGSTARKLHARGIETLADVARLGEEAMVSILGRARGRHLHAIAHNRDARPVRRGRGRRSVGAQSASVNPSSPPAQIDATLIALVDRVTRRMRSKGYTGRTVILRLRFADFSCATRSRTLPRETASTAAILAAARTLLRAARPLYARGGLTLIGVTVTNLSRSGAGVQLELAIDRGTSAALDAAVDEIRERYGADAVTRATLLRRDRTLSAWLLAGEEAERDQRAYSASPSGSSRSSRIRPRNSAPSAP
jgi:DNA polymerase IV